MEPGYGQKVKGKKEARPRRSSEYSGEETVEDSGDDKITSNSAGERKAGAAAAVAAADVTTKRPQQAVVEKAEIQSDCASDKDATGKTNVNSKTDLGDVKTPAEAAVRHEKSLADVIGDNTVCGLRSRGRDSMVGGAVQLLG